MAEIRSVEVADGVSFFVPQVGEGQFSEVSFIYKEVFEDRTYLRHGIKLSDSSRIVDAGANVGIFTTFVKQQFPGAQVLALEPIPPIYEALQRNLEAHGIQGVDARRMAVGQRNEQVHFTFYPAIPGNSTRYPEQKKVGQELTVGHIGQAEVDRVMTGVEVEAQVDRLSTVLGDWAPGEQIDLLKIDVEGAELDVMQGLDDEDWLRVQQTVIEVQDLDGRLDAITELLDGKGFSVIVERAEMPEEYRYYMVYATRQP